MKGGEWVAAQAEAPLVAAKAQGQEAAPGLAQASQEAVVAAG